MNRQWEETFRRRMSDFGRHRQPKPGEIPVSIKVRVTSGCFHREHSPHAYALIDRHLNAMASNECDFQFEEHESGPEILVYLAVTTAGIALAKSVVDLITAIVNARSKGIQEGDHPRDSLKLIVRRTRNNDEFREESILEVHSSQHVDASMIEKAILEASGRLVSDERKDERILPSSIPADGTNEEEE